MSKELPSSDQLPDLVLTCVEPIILRAAIETPVIATFGRITQRTVLLVRVEDRDGAVGWGEVFGNFPIHGAENRAHLIRDYISPILTSTTWSCPADAYTAITERTHVMTLQSGEPGPFAQAVAGIDLALWDLTARRLGEPLWRLMGGQDPVVDTYASGLNPTGFEDIVLKKLAEGYMAFKIKIGFGQETDLAALDRMRELIGAKKLMTDVNQGWDLATACANWPNYSAYNLQWIEEPLPADRPIDEWRAIAQLGGAPIAVGENIRGDANFDAHLKSGVFGVLQPDLCKWGGLTRTLPLAKRIVAAGRTYCPHFLAGAIGLMASGHCLAAAGGNGKLEIDANENPLREVLTGPLPKLNDGKITLPSGPGLGVTPDPEAIAEFRCG
ncbi:MAG: mandelate racemase/muconate lactonizing enzyme family protein [Hyphomicrobiaceae bacterium]